MLARKLFDICVFIILFFVFILFIYFENNILVVTNITLHSNKVNDNIRIVHLSDLHNKEFGKNNSELIMKVKTQKPDIIVFTGDLISRTDKDYKKMLQTLIELHKIAGVYYIPGNHEKDFFDYHNLLNDLQKNKIRVMINTYDTVKIKNTELSICGLDLETATNSAVQIMLSTYETSPNYKLLLSHFPEKFDSIYSKYKIDLVMCGHAHGGQIILPFIGGLFAPGQGILPKYYRGLHTKNGVNMVVSRGLGHSPYIYRVFNKPEIVVIDIMKSAH